MRIVAVCDYDSQWPALFHLEAAQFKTLFGTQIIDIHHIGSTSIPQMKAKPIIDILIVVHRIEAVDDWNEIMAQFGYVAYGEHGIQHRRFFAKGGDQRTHHVHVFQQGDREIARHLRFRHYMMAHPKEAARYSALKSTLAAQCPFDIDRYIEGKHTYMQQIDRQALRWQRKNPT